MTMITPLFSTGKHVKAVPEQWANGFGFQYYERQHVYCHPSLQSEADWKIRMEGELFETGKALNITPYDKLQEFVTQELKKNFTGRIMMIFSASGHIKTRQIGTLKSLRQRTS